MAPRRAHDLAVVALAALSVVAALSLGRVFAGAGFVVPVVGAALLPHLIGALARRRHWSLVVTVTVALVAMAAFAVWVVDPSSTSYGIPTGATLDTVGGHLRQGYEELRTARVPAEVTDGAMLLAIAAVWLMALTAELLAFRRDASIGAIAPGLALFIWAATLGTPALRARTTVGFAAAAIVFLLCQHQALLERRRAWFVGRRLGTGTGLARIGALAGAIAVVGGVLLGPALPGARSDALIDVKGLGGGSGDGGGGDRSYRTDPPLARIGANFVEGDRVEVFRVASPRREYWRIAALDRYSSDGGGQWTLTAEGAGEVTRGLDETGRTSDVVEQQFTIGALGGRWMPAAYRAVAVDGGDPLVVTASTTLVTELETVDGLEYTVRSQIPARPGPTTATADRPLPPRLVPYTVLPDDFPADVIELAREVVVDATNPFERAAALEAFFLAPDQGFTYSLDADVELGPEAQTTSAIEKFLIDDRRGFCVQFAGSYAAMARAVGLPARVAVGYTPGRYDAATDRYQVTTWDAHAWPEVWLGATSGWVRFEPTPPSPDGRGGGDLAGVDAGAPDAGDTPAPAPTTQVAPPPSAAPSPPATAGGEPPPADVSIDAPGRGGEGGWAGIGVTMLVAALVLVAAALVAAAAVVVLKVRRRARRRARSDPVGAIAGAWEEVRDRLGEAGVALDPAQTPFELADDAGPRLPVGAGAPLRSLAETYAAARYGPTAPEIAAAAGAWARVGEIDRALAGDVSVWVHWRRRLDPASLRRRAPDAVPELQP